ncbi:MAG: hypothetical protein CVU54_02005 [Deltaproteobacteria bacterium HGW-Deltaproteobacteria-12]|jgi:hypothetical protein|nr:MAG: hypothetical protein CVU54_02005 [Deltaproteobacteria bacterium HGW-Deltaproteobacteria-12]
MKLVCPSCGATASAEAWTNDTAIRYTFEVLVQLPSPVLRQSLSYLGLFRQGTKALPWRRALAVAKSLKDLVETGTVHWQGGETRPCNAEIWGKAIEATLASGPKGLKNHNYLRKCAWEMAAELAAKMENDREAARQKRGRDVDEEPALLSETAQKAIEKLKRSWGEK